MYSQSCRGRTFTLYTARWWWVLVKRVSCYTWVFLIAVTTTALPADLAVISFALPLRGLSYFLFLKGPLLPCFLLEFFTRHRDHTL